MLRILMFCIVNMLALSKVDILTSEKETSLGESIDIKIISDKSEVNISGLDNFFILSNRSGKSSSYINGEWNAKYIYNYSLSPKDEGTIEIRADDSEDSKSIRIVVKEEDPVAPQSYIDTVEQFKSIYVGEKVIIDYNLFSKRDIGSADFRMIPKLDSVNLKSFGPNSNGPEKKLIGLVSYSKWNVDRLVISSNKDGNIIIPRRMLDVQILDSRSFYGNFIPAYLKSKEISIDVLPLPKNDNFSGIVGHTDISHSFYGDNIIGEDESVTLTIHLSGNTNLDNIKPIYNDVDDFKVYEHIVKSEETIKDGKYYAKKEIEIVFSPKKIGKLKIDENVIEHFDVNKKEYITTVIPSYEIEVTAIATPYTENIVIEKISNNNVDLLKGRNILFIILFVLLILTFKYRSIIFSKGDIRKAIIAIKREKDNKKIFNIFVEAINSKKNVDILNMPFDNFNRYFDESISNKIIKLISLVDSNEIFGDNKDINIKKDSIEILRKIK